MNRCFQPFRLQPPHAPLPGHAFLLRVGFASDSLSGLSVVRRTSLFPSCLVSRIRPYRVRVAGPADLSVLRTSRPLSVALHLTSRSRSYFQLPGRKLHLGGTFTLRACSLASALARLALQAAAPKRRALGHSRHPGRSRPPALRGRSGRSATTATGREPIHSNVSGALAPLRGCFGL
jgi:hypothetical protein